MYFTALPLQSPFLALTQMDRQAKIFLRSCILVCLHRVPVTGLGEPMSLQTECTGISAALLSDGTRISPSYVLPHAGLLQTS